MEHELKNAVEEILHSNDLAAKRLSRKVYSIIFGMIFILTTIIIVEFKEYSNNYHEYKIGLNELGPKDLVWAGIMGTPPRYYESNEKYGLGYREFDTREIRKALEEAGINLVYRYMSPNRLEFEFERKHPICFYDRKWNNPKEYFKKKRHPILSIPLYYSAKGIKKIFFRKGEKARFEKHLDSQGNIILDSLIKDSRLKTELIRKVEYDGPYANITYGKRQLDGTYYDYVKKDYQKHIDLVILHTNDQIIQMLKWKRFDYQFLDTLEYDDYPWMDGGKKGIETLVYDFKRVQSIDDPNLILHSVACGNHPLSKLAMPIINEVIKTIRTNRRNITRAQVHELKLNPDTSRPIFAGNLVSENGLGNSIKELDKWYFYQFDNLKITPWPMFGNKEKTPKEEISKNMAKLLKSSQQPKWYLMEKRNKIGEISFVIINDIEIRTKKEEEIIKNRFLDDDYEKQNSIIKDSQLNFSKLTFSNINSIDKLIIFSRGIKDNEFELLKSIFLQPSLKSITFIESSPNQSKQFLTYLPTHIEQLRLYDVPLMGFSFSKTIAKLHKLKALDIQAGINNNLPFWLEGKELISTLNCLPNTVEILNLVGRWDVYLTDFPQEAATVFSKRNFYQLKQFTLLNFTLDYLSSKLILDSLPLNLESLIIGAENSSFGGVSSLQIENFLNARKNSNRLKRLRLPYMIFSLKSENKIFLPESLTDLELSSVEGLRDGNFNRIIIPPKMKLKKLALKWNKLNDYSIIKLLNNLDPKVEELNLEHNQLSGYAFFLHLKNRSSLDSIEIKKLILDSNPIDDFGIFTLSKLPWKIKELNLSNLKITDKSVVYLTSSKYWNLHSISLGNNFLSAHSINKILERYNKDLTELNLNNLLSLDIKELSKNISPKLRMLNLEGNMINDEDLTLLSPKLPKELNVLNISGSRMSAKGAYILSQNMPNLTRFLYDFKYGEDEEGLNYIFQTLSPFLIELSLPTESLTYNNCLLFSTHIPNFLFNLDLPALEKEECKVILSSLPNALRVISLRGDIKSKGNSLQQLTNHYPSKLSRMRLGNSISQKERDFFLSKLPYQYIFISPGGNISYSNQFIRTMSVTTILGNGMMNSEYFKNIELSSIVFFYSDMENDIPKGFLDSFQKWQLKGVRAFFLTNGKNLEVSEILDFLKKLPDEIIQLGLPMMNIHGKDVDRFIELLPKNLKGLIIRRNLFTEQELQKFRQYKLKIEGKTHLPFELSE